MLRRKKDVKKKKKVKKPLSSFPVRRFRETLPVEGTVYEIEYRLTPDRIYQVSKNRIKYAKEPKIEPMPNKTQDLRDEFSTYCGVKKTIKNWLFYV